MTAHTLPITAIPTAHDWNPQCDKDFAAQFLTMLTDHGGSWLKATDVWQSHDPYQRTLIRQKAEEAVSHGRRIGMVIEGDRQRGYCYVGMKVVRYLHMKDVDGVVK